MNIVSWETANHLLIQIYPGDYLANAFFEVDLWSPIEFRPRLCRTDDVRSVPPRTINNGFRRVFKTLSHGFRDESHDVTGGHARIRRPMIDLAQPASAQDCQLAPRLMPKT